jgi:hypothetical protein
MPNDSLKRSLERALIKSLVKGGWDRDKAESVAQQIDFANSSKIIAELKSNGTITVLQALELRLAVGNLIDYTGSCNAGGPPVFPDQTTSCQNPYLITVQRESEPYLEGRELEARLQVQRVQLLKGAVDRRNAQNS